MDHHKFPVEMRNIYTILEKLGLNNRVSYQRLSIAHSFCLLCIFSQHRYERAFLLPLIVLQKKVTAKVSPAGEGILQKKDIPLFHEVQLPIGNFFY